jgi:hypothetical protein
MAAPLFKDVGKAEKDFIEKDFADKQFNVSIKNTASPQSVFNPSVTLNNGVFSGLWKSTFPVRTGKLEWEYDTAGKSLLVDFAHPARPIGAVSIVPQFTLFFIGPFVFCKATGSFDNVLTNVKAVVGYETDPVKGGRTARAGVEYKITNLTSALTFGVPLAGSGKPNINLNLVYLLSDFLAFGFDVDVSPTDQQLPNKVVAVTYRKLPHSLLATYTAKGAAHECKLIYLVKNVGPAGVTFGGQLSVDPTSKGNVDLQAVGAWPLDTTSSLKASVNSKGAAKLAYQLKPNTFTKVTAGVQLDLTTFAAQKFGLSVDFE